MTASARNTLIGMLLLPCLSQADVLTSSQGTSITGVIMDSSTTGIVFEERIRREIPREQVQFLDVTQTADDSYFLIPQPQQLEPSHTNVRLAGPVRILCPPDSSGISAPFERELRSRGIEITTASRQGYPVGITLSAANGTEGYAILVETSLTQVTAHPQSLRYAAATLSQLVTGQEQYGLALRKCSIRDNPDLLMRICHLPRLTHRSDLKLFRRYAHILSSMKFNMVILEMSGSVKLDSHPEACWSDAFSKDDVRDLVRDISSLGLEVVPELNSFGHTSEWLGTEPGEREKYRLAEVVESSETLDTLCPSSERTYKMLFDIYDELIPIFGKPRYFHIGMDEAERRRFGHDGRCDGKDPAVLFASHLNRVSEYFKERGITVMMWGDLLLDPDKFPGIDNCNGGAPTHFARAVDMLDTYPIVMDWHYDTLDPYPSAKFLKDKGFEVIPTPWLKPANIYAHAQSARRLGARGICATMWNFFDKGYKPESEIEIVSAPILVGAYAWNLATPPPSELPWKPDIVFRREWNRK